MDWLDRLPFRVMKGDGFIVNNYGHPSFIRYIEGNRLLTLSYKYADETEQRGRRFLIFRTYAIHIQIPTKLTWDDGTPLNANKRAAVLDRICRTMEQYKKHPCQVIVNDSLYEQLASTDRQIRERSSPLS